MRFFRRPNPVKFYCRPNTGDGDIFRAITDPASNEYQLPASLEGMKVLDIGAHIGSFSHACLLRGARYVYAFEAEPSNYEVCRRNLEPFIQKGKADARNQAVWRSDLARMPLLSFTPSADPQNTGGGNVFFGDNATCQVPSVSLDSIIEEVGDIDMLKIDCESSEFPILLTATKLARIHDIRGEFHEVGGIYNPQATIPDKAQVGSCAAYTIESLRECLGRHGFGEAAFKRYRYPDGRLCHIGMFFFLKREPTSLRFGPAKPK